MEEAAMFQGIFTMGVSILFKLIFNFLTKQDQLIVPCLFLKLPANKVWQLLIFHFSR